MLLSRFLLAAFLAWLIAIAYAWIFQNQLIFHPHRAVSVTPRDMGLAYANVSFDAADGVRLAGWEIPCAGATRTLLFCHGNAGNIGDFLEAAVDFHNLGLNVLMFDFRGYGASEGRPTVEGVLRDCEAAWRFLTQERALSPDKIILCGRSLGGAFAVELALRHAANALILESTFTSLADVGKAAFPIFPVNLMVGGKLDSLSRIVGISCPLLVVHGTEDELIPFAHGRRLFEAAPAPKWFLAISGDHNGCYYTSASTYRSGVAAFLEETTE